MAIITGGTLSHCAVTHIATKHITTAQYAMAVAFVTHRNSLFLWAAARHQKGRKPSPGGDFRAFQVPGNPSL
ncbi:MAG: hypothetical protein K2Q97_13360 [Burkholderiaceae bacterium]|nr:hypothetical protein [Burkholderiaceae bacterium]